MKLRLILLVFSVAGFAQITPGPFLFSPANYSNYIQTNKLNLSWLKIDGEEFYKIQHSLDSNFAPLTIEENIARYHTNATISDLQLTSTYFWRVKADKDSSDWSDVWRFTTTGNPVVPNLFSPTNLANNQQQTTTFTWSSNHENSNYQLHISSFSNLSDTVRLVEQSDTLIEISGLKTNTIYYWHVKSFNTDGIRSDWSEILQFKTVLATPTQVFPQNFTNNADTALSLRWVDVPSASNFNVLLSTDPLFEDAAETISANVLINKLEIDSLKTNSIYYWKVIAVNAFTDSSNWSDVFRFKTKLASPSLIYPSDSTNNININLTFKWTSTSDFDNYNIQIALDKNFNSIIIEEELSRDSLFASLDNWTNYFWRVSGKNNLGDLSNWSQTNQFRTKLPQPILVSPSNDSYFVTTNYNFSWHNVLGADEYSFQLSEFQNYSSLLFNITTTDSSLILDSLSLNSTYYWRILASSEATDTSRWSNSYKLNTTTILVETDSINTELNYSVNPTDTIGTIQIHNYGNNEAKFSSILALPDSIYFPNITSATIPPNTTKSIIVFGDTTKIDTGFYFGTLKLIPDQALSTEDTIKIPITTFAFKSVGIIRADSLNYDTVSVATKVRESFILSNVNGNYPLQINSFFFSGNDTTAFNIINLPQTIQPGDSSSVSVEFSPVVLDSNKAELIIVTNSYPKNDFTVTLTGVGKGGNFTDSTLNTLIQLSDTTFETLTNNNKEIEFKNNGNSQIILSTSFVENYFKQIETSSTIKLNPGDSTTITFQYITPNFDTLNIDTLKINHNAFGENPISIPLFGTFDSLKTSKRIVDNLYVNNMLFTNEDYQFEENKSISFSLNENPLADSDNLNFKINYYQGGPGIKQTATNAGDNKFVIPFQNVNNSGMLFKGELFTKQSLNSDLDSVTIFDFKNAQIIFDNYSTPEIMVPKSTAGNTADEATSKWVMFGFPFETVIADSLFAQFGGISNMEDGEWIVYNYENDLNGFIPFEDYSISSGTGYFIAQSMQNTFTISYNYKNQILSKKLTDAKITLQNPGEWNTISSPFTFPVEVDTPAVLYKYDANNLRYSLTNIMRTGEAYFVEPTISELNLKTYGEYYPDLFPKITKYSNWTLTLLFNSETVSDEIVVSMLESEKTAVSKINYLNPPNITSSFDAYIKVDNDGNKYHSDFTTASEGAVWNVQLFSSKNDEQINITSLINGEFPKHFSILFLDENNIKVGALTLTKGVERTCKLIVGTEKFIKETTNSLNSQLPSEFKLSQNYPNPFNPSTVIRYEVGDTRFVTLKIFDVLGREVATLVNKGQSAGNYEVNFDASGLSSGFYFCKLNSGSYNKTMKMLLLK